MKKMFHMNVKIFSRGKGHNFRQKLAYRDGGMYEDKFTGQAVNYHRKHFKDKIENDFITPEGADDSLKNRGDYYDALEEKEKAKNAQFFREFEVAFPNDLSKEDNKDIARRFGQNLADEGMFVDINYHQLDSKNPHAHILTSMRGVNEKGLLGNKNRDWNDRENVEKWRGKFAEIINEKYKELGINNSVDHRSYKEQGVKKVATKKLPVNKRSQEYKDRIKLNKSIRLYNKDNLVKDLKHTLSSQQENFYLKKKDLKDLTKTIGQRTQQNKTVDKLLQAKREIKKDFTYEKIKIARDKKTIELHKKTKEFFNENKKAKDRGQSL